MKTTVTRNQKMIEAGKKAVITRQYNLKSQVQIEEEPKLTVECPNKMIVYKNDLSDNIYLQEGLKLFLNKFFKISLIGRMKNVEIEILNSAGIPRKRCNLSAHKRKRPVIYSMIMVELFQAFYNLKENEVVQISYFVHSMYDREFETI